MILPNLGAGRLRRMLARVLTFGGLALAYAVLGRLGLALAVPPGYVTAIWPPAGIALAFVLLHGYGVWPAIAAGALLLNLWAPQIAGPLSGLPQPWDLAAFLGISAAAAAQAVLGAALVRRFGRFPNPIDTVGRVAALVVLGGAVPSLLYSVGWSVALVFTAHIARAGTSFATVTGWTGGTLGVAIFAPLLLAWFDPRRDDWNGRRAPVTVWLAVTFAVALALAAYGNARARDNLQQDLDEVASGLSGRFEKTLAIYVHSVQSLEELCAANSILTGEEFHLFADSIRARVPGIRALTWAPRVTAEERADFETMHRHPGNGNYQIKQTRDGQLLRAPDSEEYFPIEFSSSLNEGRIVGIDIGGEAVRRAAIGQARNTGSLTVTGRVSFFTGQDAGVIAFMPVYQPSQNDAVEARHRDLRGFALAVFAAPEILRVGLADADLSGFHYWLIDATDAAAPVVLAANVAAAPSPFLLADRGLFGGTVSLRHVASFELGGRHWQLQVVPTVDFVARYRRDDAWILLLGGMAFTALVAASALVVSGRERLLRRTAEERSRARDELEVLNHRILDEAEARFAVLMNNVADALVIVDERGAIEGFNRAAERAFGFATDEVRGASPKVLSEEVGTLQEKGSLAYLLEHGKSDGDGSTHEVMARRKNGDLFPAEMVVSRVVVGENERVVGIIRDISERKEAERELRESEGRFRDLAGSASDWFWETDRQYRLTFLSERIGTALGAKPSALLGFSFFDLGLAEQDIAVAHRADVAARRPFRDLVFHIGPSGRVHDNRFIRISGIPFFDGEGEFGGYRGVGIDVTREVVAERRATLAQQQLADAIDSVSDGIGVFDAEDRLVICNRAHPRMFGSYGNYPVPGTSFEALLDSNPTFVDTGDLSFDEWKAARLEHHRQAAGHPFMQRTREGRWILCRDYHTSDGGVICVRSDVTEIKRREGELDTLRRRYQSILDSAGEGIVGLDPLGIITFANRMAETVLGYDRNALIGGDFRVLVQPCLDDSPVVEACRAGMRREVDDELFRRRDGRDFPVDYFIAPIVESSANLGAVLIFRDATLRIDYERSLANHRRDLERQVAERTSQLKREVEVRAAAEGALRGSRERLKRITDSLFEGLLVVDRFGQIAFANPSAKRLLDCNAVLGDVEGLSLSTFLRLRGKDGDVPFESSLLPRVFEYGVTVLDDDAVFALASGRAFSVAYACSPLPDDDGRKAVVISFRDTEQLKTAQREALQSSRLASVGQLAAGIAHEINTPVQYIGDNLRYVGSAVDKLLRVVAACPACATAGAADGESESRLACEFQDAYAAANVPVLAKEAKLAVEESLDGVGQIARIVLSMKEFSHPGTSKKVMIDINRALDRTLTVTRNEWKHAAEIHKQFDPSLPPVLCHPGEMNQVFLNLIVNAVHAIQASGKPSPGQITVTTTYDDTAVEIRVADTGTGVPHALMDKIFDPFFTTKEVGKGTGQGLAICRNVVVTKHGGTITVDGKDGEGAVFVVRLPIESNDQDGEREGE